VGASAALGNLVRMDDPGAQLHQALDLLGEVGRELTVEQAVDEIDSAVLQTFWNEWPQTSEWAAALWERLDDDLAEPAKEPTDPDLDEVGEGD
jgi:hypothetical protein